jgi:hypothetical protein
MKIVATDNFANETVADDLICENIKIKEYADTMCKALNEKFCNSEYSPRHFQVWEDDKRLSRGMEDLV